MNSKDTLREQDREKHRRVARIKLALAFIFLSYAVSTLQGIFIPDSHWILITTIMAGFIIAPIFKISAKWRWCALYSVLGLGILILAFAVTMYIRAYYFGL
jgi:hypothetical protein